MTNRVLHAGEALAWGLVNEVVDDAGLAEAAAALAARLSSGATGAFGALKRLMAESEPGLEAQLGRESRSIAARGTPPRERRASRRSFEEAHACVFGNTPPRRWTPPCR